MIYKWLISRFWRLLLAHMIGRLVDPFIQPYKRAFRWFAAGVAAVIIGCIGTIVGGIVTGGPGAIPGVALLVIGLVMAVLAVARAIRSARGHVSQAASYGRKLGSRRSR